MKKYIFVIILFFVCASMLAQDVQVNRVEQGKERLKAQRVAFLTERIDLSPDEAEKFWPMFNQFENDKKALHKKYKRQKRVTEMTDVEVEKYMLDLFEKDQELLDLKKAYFQKFKKILPVKKLAMLQVAEREFKRSIVNKVRENRGRRRNRDN